MVYELINSNSRNWKKKESGEKGGIFFREWRRFFFSPRGREKCRKRRRKQEAARKRRERRYRGDDGATGSPVFIGERVSERASARVARVRPLFRN